MLICGIELLTADLL